MSRGLGKTQRLVLEILAEKAAELPEYRWVSVFEIAHHVRCDGDLTTNGLSFSWEWRCAKCDAVRPTPAESESVRRAMRKLAAAGLVEADHFVENIGRRHEWVNRRAYADFPAARKQIFVRLPLTAKEAEEEQERRRQLDAKLAVLAGPFGH